MLVYQGILQMSHDEIYQKWFVRGQPKACDLKTNSLNKLLSGAHPKIWVFNFLKPSASDLLKLQPSTHTDMST